MIGCFLRGAFGLLGFKAYKGWKARALWSKGVGL